MNELDLKKVDLKMYSFENALNMIQNTAEVFNEKRIDDVFSLADRIYKYLNNIKDGE